MTVFDQVLPSTKALTSQIIRQIIGRIRKSGPSLDLPDVQAKLAGVIERLAYQTGDSATGIEIHPTTKDDMKVRYYIDPVFRSQVLWSYDPDPQ